MALMHGFKAHAAWLATRIRRKLGVTMLEPLDVFVLASAYEIDVLRFSEIDHASAAIRHLQGPDNSKVSGFALPVDERHLIAYNDADCMERIRSTMGHEVGHVLLQHEPVLRVASDTGCVNSADVDQEAEATELSGELLIPAQVAKRAAIDQRPAEDLAAQFQTSVELARWRMNLSGGHQIRLRARSRKS